MGGKNLEFDEYIPEKFEGEDVMPWAWFCPEDSSDSKLKFRIVFEWFEVFPKERGCLLWS